MNVPEQVTRLIETFDRNIEAYKDPEYNETQLRHEFVDPFFMALGWDVNNTAGLAEAYKDVIHEDSIRIGSATKAPDYCFRIGGTRKFFVEAKKPSISIKDAPHPAFQLRRYAWSAKLPLSILTDFEEFAVYDCRVRPVKADRSSAARIKYIKYTEYPDRWDEIASVFSKDAILKGSFDKYAKSARRKRGTAEVDTAFLNEIETWRDIIARNIAVRNPSLTNRRLNFAVQRTIDRIIFLRIAEDRGIERYGELLATASGPDTYLRLFKLFEKADDRYNSGLFHFHKEPDRDEPDDLTPTLTIDDKPLKDIIKSLYYPDSPYEFAVLPAEILGQIYEQFLGKVITLTKGHHARIEYKPEVKKAGGVYYTPSYIVDYIVKNTVGKLLETKTPTAVNNLKILDPACGSGSFLIAAYQYLLDWYLKYYSENDPSKYTKGRNPKLYQTDKGDYRLTIGERKRIVLNNIFGVDIYSQAVEVTKLSLLLKVLEGQAQLVLFHKERALPDLGSNIKCGNSLIGPDFYEKKQLTMFDEEERYRINVFDWKKEFPKILNRKKPGFDTVIGNPPYLAFYSKQSVKSYYPVEYDYLVRHAPFLCGHPTKRINSVMFFMERGVNLLRPEGLIGLIIDMSVHEDAYTGIRKFMFENTQFLLVVPYISAFKKVSSSQSLFVAAKKPLAKLAEQTAFIDGQNLSNMLATIPQEELIGDDEYNIQYTPFSPILRKITNTKHILLKDISSLSRGMVVSKDFVVNEKQDKHTYKCVFGTNINRYFLQYPTREQLQNLRGRGKYIIHSKTFEEQINAAFKKQGRNTVNVIGQKERFLEPKIFVRYTPTFGRVEATYDQNGYFSDHTLSLINNIQDYDPRFLLGILNSKLLGFYALHKRLIKAEVGKIPQFPTRKLGQLPICTLDLSDPKDKSHHDKIVSLVESMLDLNKQLAKAKTTHEKTALKRQIDTTDRQIDNLVYKLYDLTDEEIAIIKESHSK